MDLNRVALFVRIIEAGSLSAAASAARVPPSSVSRTLSSLERELGVRLLQRTTRRLALTDAGRLLFERSRPLIGGLETLGETVVDLGTEPRGLVRLTAPADIAANLLADAIAEFRSAHPEIRVELSLTSKVLDLVADGFDLGVRAGRLADSSLIVRQVGTPSAGLFASPSYVAKHGRPRRLEDLARHECILFRADRGQSTWRLKGPSGDQAIDVVGSVAGDDASFILRAVEAGCGVGLLPLFLAERSLRTRTLVRVLGRWTMPLGPLSVVLPSSRYVPTRVTVLRDFLVRFLTARCRA
jgi:DNA-binding transcriptional LysR family regulator